MILDRRNASLPTPPARDPQDINPPMICHAIFEEICILANGNIVCSCADPVGYRVYGNVYNDRIDHVFNGPMYQEMRHWQLCSMPQSWCPVVQYDCGLRTNRANNDRKETGCSIKRLQLEPTSYCNLSCPECLIGLYKDDADFRKERDSFLPLKVMENIIEQIPDLELMWFYNFGESFLHPDAIPFLRYFRSHQPNAHVIVNTNGMPLDSARIDAIASEVLATHFSFSIDGVWQSSYAAYRKNGNIRKALANLEAMARACDRYRTKDKIKVIWQYILFEWNDSDEEINAAKHLAKEIGCNIQWILTHTRGASPKFTLHSPAYQKLISTDEAQRILSCELQLEYFLENEGAKEGIYLASLTPGSYELHAAGGSVVKFPLNICNLAQRPWKKTEGNAFRLGIQLLSETGNYIRELPPIYLPEEVLMPKGQAMLNIEITAPQEKGTYKLLVDVVEELVCWFSEKGSPAAIIKLYVS